MKYKLIFAAAVFCSLSACAFFDEPLDDVGTVAPPSPASTRLTVPAPPPLPTSSQATPSQQATPTQVTPTQATGTTTEPAAATKTYFIVTTIFDVPENAANLSFVHFTDRSSRRETVLCEALLNKYPITRLADLPADAQNLIIWPVTEGTSADNCSAMVRAHEPLDISSQTAATVSSNGPYLLSRNAAQQKQMIYDLSATPNGRLSTVVNEWQQQIESDVASWPPVVKLR